MQSNSLRISEVKDIINYTIDNNEKLAKQGKRRVAINIVGERGLGKTSIIEQIAKERNMGYTKVALSQLEEIGDLIGFPCKEFEAQLFKAEKQADGTVKKVPLKLVWGNENAFKNLNPNMYKFTGNTRMGYAKPSWIPKYNENGNIVLLDDWTRCTPVFVNAIMDLIKDQEYMSWKLPEKTIVLLTSNPDNGSYNVSALDPAQEGRYVDFVMEFNIDDWAKWAEKVGMDGRAINFALAYSDELFGMDDQGNAIADPRRFEMFSNMISGIDDWEKPESLAFIFNVAKGCFHDSQNKFGTMFTTFIKNRMHAMIQPKQMLEGKWDTVHEKMHSTIYGSDGQYHPAIASVLERRFANYVNAWLDSDEQTPIRLVKDRILDFIRTEKLGSPLFTEDLIFHMVKTITSDHKAQTGKLLYDPEIAQKVI